MEENVASPNTRVRINLSQSAKGLGQLDITAEAPTAEAPTAEAPTAEAPTAEAPTVEEAKALLSNAIDEARAVMAEKGIKEAGRE